MKTLSTLAGCALATLVATGAFAETDVHVNINLGNAPPPPVVVVRHEPRMVWLPELRVSVADDRDYGDDYFQCGSYWYSYHDGWWYRARSWRGPFSVIEYRYVPRSVISVPERHWRHHPRAAAVAHARRVRRAEHGREVVVVKERGRGHGKGREHGDHD